MTDTGTEPLTRCPDPECRAPAIVVDRYVATSTDGDVAHTATRCMERHHYVTTEESVR